MIYYFFIEPRLLAFCRLRSFRFSPSLSLRRHITIIAAIYTLMFFDAAFHCFLHTPAFLSCHCFILIIDADLSPPLITMLVSVFSFRHFISLLFCRHARCCATIDAAFDYFTALISFITLMFYFLPLAALIFASCLCLIDFILLHFSSSATASLFLRASVYECAVALMASRRRRCLLLLCRRLMGISTLLPAFRRFDADY